MSFTGGPAQRATSVKVIVLRRPDSCSVCGTRLEGGTRAEWDPTRRTVRCLSCRAGESVPQLDTPSAGGSAQREFQRRAEARERRIRARFPRIGGLLLALVDDPASTRVWAQGAAGERAVGAALDELRSLSVYSLHDRRVVTSDGRPSRANIDHLVVSATGVWVVDAKTHHGRLQVRRSGGLFGPRIEELYVGGRKRTALVEGVERQVESVRRVLGELDLNVPVGGVLCFVGTELPWLGETIPGIPLVGRRGLARLMRRPGRLTPDECASIAERLDRRFLPA